MSKLFQRILFVAHHFVRCQLKSWLVLSFTYQGPQILVQQLHWLAVIL